EGKARAARVDEHETAWQWPQQFGPLAGAQVGADKIELRLLAVHRRAVSDEQDDQLIVLSQPAAQIRESSAHVFPCGLLHALAIRQNDDVVLRVPEGVAERIDERLPPSVVLLRVRLSASRASHDQRVAFAGKRARARELQKGSKAERQNDCPSFLPSCPS